LPPAPKPAPAPAPAAPEPAAAAIDYGQPVGDYSEVASENDCDGLPFFDNDDVQLRAQWHAFHMVWKRCRDLGDNCPSFVRWATNLGIDLKTVYDRVERGDLLASRYTREDDEYFRATFGKFLPIVPHGETGPECDARRRAFKYAARAKEEAMEQQTYTRPDLPPPVAGKITPTVDKEGRLRSLAEGLPLLPTKSTIAREAKRLRKHPAWCGPNGQLLALDYLEKESGG
jgi:hypothetical protein